MLEEEEEEELPGTVSCPGAVLGLAAQPGSNEVRLTWTPAEARGADDDDPGVADPEWFGVVVRQGGDTRMVRVDAPATGTVITGLRNRVEASFEVYAVTEDGSSEPAGPITATPITGMEGEVAGLIVAFEPGVEVSETDQSVPGESRVDSVDLSIAGKVTDDAVLVELSDAVSLAEAEQIAAELQGDPAVAWAEPDQFIFTASTQPQGPLAETVSVPDDARYATDQWNLWDQFGIGIGDGSTSMTDAWAQGTGEGATVAVIDTGITAHPDLDSQLVTGFDFVSNPEQLAAARTEGGEPVAFDADATNPSAFGDAGWDANPTDPGDWRGVAPTPDSSWHGTKVAGVIAAQARNSEGIAGIAPGAKIQPIRALSWRGGLLSDIAASITWASGGIVDGAPANATPADVINLSLAAETFCPTALQQAIEGARERGAVIIAAAGNANDDAAKYAPGNCNGVITVAATDRSGVRAPYSNFGERIDISAPGGNTATDGGILTTSNTGTTDTSEPTWAADQGTSYAAAHVTAAAAILKARDGTLTPDTIEQQLTGSIRPFASETCDSDPTRDCGPGILSLAQIAAAAGGDEDYAMTFDGTNQYATAPDNSAFEPTEALTFEAWLRPNTSCSSLQQFLRKELQFALGCQSGTWRYAFANGSWYNGGWIDTGVSVRTGSWQHFAVTRSSATSSILFYLDGQLAYTGAAANTLGNTANALYVASGDGASTYFSGGLDELRIFNVARSEAEIQADMHTYGPTNLTGLLAYYDFNEGPAGTTGTGTVYNRADGATSATNLRTVNGPTYTDVKQTTINGNNTVVTFPRSYLTAAGGWRPPTGTSNATVLAVGGGGGGGGRIGGGGGGGGVTESTGVTITSGAPVPVVVGVGGLGGTTPASGYTGYAGGNGTASTFGASSGSVAASGGGGGAGSNTGNDAGSGATGGGASWLTSAGTGSAGGSGGESSTFPQSGGTVALAGGGGGADSAAAGGSAESPNAGSGGAGKASSISGATQYFGGGGGGGIHTTGTADKVPGQGGSGGGGSGAEMTNASIDVGARGGAGTAGTGGGGGGASITNGESSSAVGGNGGSGVVIVSYAATPAGVCAPTSTSYTSGGKTYRVLAFKNVDAPCGWEIPTGVTTLDYLVVAGGGGGASGLGGGGAGGMLQGSTDPATQTLSGSLEITVGAGGAGGAGHVAGQVFGGRPGSNGSASKLSGGGLAATVNARGGGGGGGARYDPRTGSDGGSGGGAGLTDVSGGEGTAGQGNGGAAAAASGSTYIGGGGGGADAAGVGGNGGTGKDSTFLTSTVAQELGVGEVSGGSAFFAGGGGAGARNMTAGSGGTGGGGDGSAGFVAGEAGAPFTGGGGGSGGWDGLDGLGAGGEGGSGVVVLRYEVTSSVECSPLTYGYSDDTTSYSVLEFQSAGTCGWTPPAGVTKIDYLLVGGGGGGGAWVAAGGGGGGVVSGTNIDVTPGENYPVTVGSGGTGAVMPGRGGEFIAGTNGAESILGSLASARGGGVGATYNEQAAGSSTSAAVATGGGGSAINSPEYYTGGLGTNGQGYAGGNGETGSSGYYPTGGGGGAGGPGDPSQSATQSGAGGIGRASSITGATVYYGGGGGGGSHGISASDPGISGAGGLGGGGAGTAWSSAPGGSGTDGLGGGGGGGAGPAGPSFPKTTTGGDGGDGVVIVSYTNTPGSPSVSSAIASAPTDVEVTWSAPSHTGTSDITGYTVTSSPGGLTCSTSAVAPNAPDTSCTVSGLTPGTSYTFTVVATNASGDGPASSASSAVVPFGELAKFAVTSTSDGAIGTQTAGESFTIKVVALDSGDRTVANWTGTVEISSVNTTISSGSGTTAAFSAGVLASHAVTVTTAGAGKTLTASNPSVGAGTGTSNGFTVDAGAASVATSTITAATSPVAINGGTSLITVQLKDQFGNELQTTGGTVALTSDLGSVGTVTDNGDGTYSATFTSGTVAGDATISGTLDSANIADTAAVVVNPGAASKLVVSPIGAQVAGVGFPVTVTLTDTFGNAVNNTGAIGSVALSRVSGTGTLGGSTSGSIGVGASSVTISGVTYSKAETGVSVLATGSGVGSLVASKTGTSGTFAVTAGAATQYSVTLSTSTPVAGSNVTVTAQLQDGDGNDVATAGKTVTWSKSILGGSFASATTLTDANGQATVVFTAPTVSGTSGAITATDNTTPTPLTGTSALLTTQVGPVDAAESTLAASASSVTADGSSTVTLTVQAKDQYGNNLTSGGATVVITQSSGSATLSGVTDNGNGTYTATVTSPITAGSSVFVATIDLSAVQGGTGSQQQVTVTYVAGAAAKLVITGSGSQVAGQSQTITITAQDAKGNTATTYTGSKTLRFGGANPSSNPVTVPTVGGIAFGSDTTVNFSSGQATANMVLFKAEAASISVTDPADSLTSSGAGNLAVTVSVNDPNKLVVSTQPVAAASGALFSTQPVVRILDAYGNQTNSAATVTMTVAGVGGVLGGSESTGKAASSGVVTFTNLTFAGRVGTTYKLEFDSGALTGADSDDFTPTGAGTAETIALNAGDGETATAGSAVPTPPSVQVTDSAGNPVSGIAVAFTVTGGGGSRAPTSAVNTNASGIAALTSWTLGTTAGANTLQASASGLTGSPVSFTATGTPGSADSLRSSQTLSGAASGAAFTTQPWISIVDANDNVVTTDNGTVVTASVSAGGTLVGTSTASTVNGVAKFTNLGLTGTSGTQYTVTFSASGVNSVDQSVTVTTGAAFKLVVTTSASGATYDNVWTTQPVVQIQDTGGNLVTTDSATDVTVAIAGQTLTGTTTVQALNGVATFSGLSLTAAPDTYTLTFTSSPALTGTSSALVLTQAAQTISFGGLGAKTFGDAPFSVAATASPSGLTVTFASQTGTVCSVSGTTVTILAAGTCTIRASQDGNTNYIAAPTVDQSFTVNQATPTFTWANTVVDYGTGPYPIAAPVSSTPGTFAYSSSDTSVISIIGSQITVAGAGTAVITATFTPTDGSNYSSGGTVTSSITVNAVELTVTASSPTVTYGDTIPTVTASIAGFVNGENSSVITTQPTCTTTYTQTANAGTSPSTSCSGAVAANYTFQYVSGAVTINKATPTLGSWSNVSKTYGDAAFALAAPSVTGVTGSVLPGTFDYGSGSTAVATVSGDTVTIAGVGSSVFTATFTPADTTNYTSTSTTMTLSVSAGTITVTASSPSVLFGAAVPTITATMTGFAYGQTDAVLTTQPVCSTAYTTTSPAGSTPSTSCSGAVAVNYTFVYVPGSVTIGQATPSLGAWANVSTTYGDPLFTLVDPAATGVTGASLAGSWDFSSGTTGVATVSGNTVSIAGAGSSVFTATFTPTDSTNYTTASTTMTLTVATTVLTVTASSASVIFGASVPSITPSYSGFVYGQGAGDLGTAPTCTTTYTDTSPVGPYPTICSGGVSNNYAFDYVAGTVAVSQATPTLSWSDVTKTYGDAPFAVTAPTATGVGGAAVTGSYIYTSSDTSVATVSGGAVTIVGTGSTTLTATFTPASGNYASGQTVTSTLTVNRASQAALSITSPDRLIFGQTLTLAASGGSGTGAVTFSAVDGTATGCSATSTLGYSSTGTCMVTANKASDTNYVAATPATQTVTIDKAGQTLAFTSTVPASPLPNGRYSPTVSSVSAVTGTSTGITPTLAAAGACSLAGGEVTFTVTGTCTITATAVGPYANYLAAAPVTQVIAVGSLNQNIDFVQPANRPFGSAGFALGATASSGLTVEYSLGAGTTNSACSVTPLGTVTILAVGTCEVVASQPGDAQYAAASNVTRAFQILPALATAPTLTSASASSQAITVGFTAPGFTGGVAITAYRLVATGGGSTVTTTACTSSPCTISGLENGTSYTVTVAAINSAGTGPASGASTALTPATAAFAVRNLSAAPDNTVVDVDWDQPADLGGGTFTRYDLSYRVAGTGAYGTPIQINPSVAGDITTAPTSYRVTGLANGTSYDFKVVTITSTESAEFTGNTAEVVQYPSTVPSAPRFVTVLPDTATDVVVSWSAPLSDGGSALTSPNYTVTVTSSTPGAASVTCVPVSTNTYCSALALSNDAIYTFTVVANNRMGASVAESVDYSVPSSNALLSNLTISSGSLTPAFDSNTFTYSVAAANAVSSITLTPTTDSGSATVTVDGVAVTSGTASQAIALTVGSNVIDVVVTASDPRYTQTYTVTVTRAAAPPVPSGGGGGGMSPSVPVTPPSGVMNGTAIAGVLVNGAEESDVLWRRNATNSGWSASSPEFSLTIATELPDGAPESLAPNGEMRVPQGGRIVVAGSGYEPGTELVTFAIPRDGLSVSGARAPRSMAGVVHIGSAVVNASGGIDVTFTVAQSMDIGQYVLQINGASSSNQVRSVNALLRVIPAEPEMRAGSVREAAFYKGRTAKLSKSGREKLAAIVDGVPKGATNVRVSVVGVAVSQGTPKENLELARARAEVLVDQLVASGVKGDYSVSVSTNFQVRTVDKPTLLGVGMNAPAVSSAGKPLTTVTIAYDIGPP